MKLFSSMESLSAPAPDPSAFTLAEMGFWHRLWMRDLPGTEAATATDEMYMWLWWFCVAWFVFLMALMFYFVVKYRRRAGQIAPRSASHNTPLEIAWTIIPTLFLVFIFFKGFWGYMDKMVAPGNAIEMNLTGVKWKWILNYQNGAETAAETEDPLGVRRVPVFYMPAGVPVKLKMLSQDVMHSFWVPDFRIKQDVLPNRYTTVWFQAKAPSGDKVHKFIGGPKGEVQTALEGVPYEDHWVFCAEYCGDEHSEMAAVIRVIPDNVWTTWVSYMKDNPDDTLDKIGERVWKQKCNSCHTVDGGTNTGPTWKDLYGSTREFTDGTTAVADDNYIREQILYPSRKITKGYGNNMTPFVGLISEKQILGVIEYMKLNSVHHKPAGAPEAGAGDAPAPDAPANPPASGQGPN